MRELSTNELTLVSGAGAGCGCSPMPPAKAGKGNNGFGNGSDAPNLAAPGNSGKTPGDKDFSLVR